MGRTDLREDRMSARCGVFCCTSAKDASINTITFPQDADSFDRGTRISPDMLKLHAAPFLEALIRISKMAQVLSWMRAEGHVRQMSFEIFQEFVDHSVAFATMCSELQLAMTTISANKLILCCEEISDRSKNGTVELDFQTVLGLQARTDEVCSRIKDELGLRLLLVIPTHTAMHYDQIVPSFGRDFEERFPGAKYDLSEAGKCIALGRSTAAVFHLMRILESGLRAVHVYLGIDVAAAGIERNWGRILGRIREKITERGRDWIERDDFQEIFALLSSAKDAWRNPTMHVEKKYTEEEAEEIFVSIRSFMKRLSRRMKEDGKPQD
ncbi:HEPN domain-containing protein [Methylocella silvestris]|uniref:HEPN domain-containing protein n=1 Tax=Methylocella silvestris TaxID=199596 RepID=A0A2J7TMA4_METSI|nr:HEPN domain-containing protein [Methylocella silvestris]PNG27902.1 hypothetical protein CR492_03160 [Methylocella silvestris]